jgi:hypothetical protein
MSAYITTFNVFAPAAGGVLKLLLVVHPATALVHTIAKPSFIPQDSSQDQWRCQSSVATTPTAEKALDHLLPCHN